MQSVLDAICWLSECGKYLVHCVGRTSPPLSPASYPASSPTSPAFSPAIPYYRAEHDHAGSSSPAAGPDDLWTVCLSGHRILPSPGLLTGKTFPLKKCFLTNSLKSVFKAPLMNLRQLENKVFKNSTGFLKHGRIFF